jgi:hypothetical protein
MHDDVVLLIYILFGNRVACCADVSRGGFLGSELWVWRFVRMLVTLLGLWILRYVGLFQGLVSILVLECCFWDMMLCSIVEIVINVGDDLGKRCLLYSPQANLRRGYQICKLGSACVLLLELVFPTTETYRASLVFPNAITSHL